MAYRQTYIFHSKVHPVIPNIMKIFQYFCQNFTIYKLWSNFEDCACLRTKISNLHTPRVPYRVSQVKVFFLDHTQSPQILWEKHSPYFRNLSGHMFSNINQLIIKQLESINYIFLLYMSGHVNKSWIWTKKYSFFIYI